MKTSYGLEYDIIREIPEGWSEYDQKVAGTHMSWFGCIIVDAVYRKPIDNEYDLEAIEEEGGVEPLK